MFSRCVSAVGNGLTAWALQSSVPAYQEHESVSMPHSMWPACLHRQADILSVGSERGWAADIASGGPAN